MKVKIDFTALALFGMLLVAAFFIKVAFDTNQLEQARQRLERKLAEDAKEKENAARAAESARLRREQQEADRKTQLEMQRNALSAMREREEVKRATEEEHAKALALQLEIQTTRISEGVRLKRDVEIDVLKKEIADAEESLRIHDQSAGARNAEIKRIMEALVQHRAGRAEAERSLQVWQNRPQDSSKESAMARWQQVIRTADERIENAQRELGAAENVRNEWRLIERRAAAVIERNRARIAELDANR